MMHLSEPNSALSSGTEMTHFEQEFVSRFLQETIGCEYSDCPGDLAKWIFRSLTRQEEVENSTRDALGRWQAEFSMDEKEHSDLPRIDEELFRLEAGLSQRNPLRERRLRWPEGRPFALCLSHDVDYVTALGHGARFVRRFRRLFTAEGSRRVPAKLSLASLYRLMTNLGGADRYRNYDQWLKLEEKFGYRSTFYFCPSVITRAHVFDTDYKYPDPVVFDGARTTVAGLIRQIKKSGWDIGLHGSYYSAETEGLLREQKQELESVLGESVSSCRQHYLQYDVTRTPKFQSDAGFAADSTQGFTTSIGFRAKTSLPYPCWDPVEAKMLPIVEIPLHVMDTALFFGVNPPADEDAAVGRIVRMMDNIERVHGCLTLNWHPHNMVRPAIWNTYCRVLEEAHRRGAWGCSVEQLTHWWGRD